MNRIVREPLAHFLALGALLYAVGSWRAASRPSSNEIVVTPGVVENLAAGFARSWHRPPTDAELRALVNDHVREEVYYREALALGLDRGDPIVRRRLRQKIEFLTEGPGETDAPPDSVLRAFVDRHADDYRVEAHAAFRHVYFSPDRRGADARADAERFLATVTGRPLTAAPADAGDSFLLPLRVELLPASQIAGMFGDEFAAALLSLEPGRWAGPLASGYGLHAVFVSERTDARVPELAEVYERVLADWRRARREEIADAAYERLRERYEVTVEWPADGAS